MAEITRYCFLKDNLGQFPLPVVKSRQTGGQVSSKNINGDTFQLYLGFLFVFRWTNGRRKSKLTDKGYQLKFSDYWTKH